nr:MAG TPA: hypothetical protein [Bacteriophage sp.]
MRATIRRPVFMSHPSSRNPADNRRRAAWFSLRHSLRISSRVFMLCAPFVQSSIPSQS